MKVQTSKMLDTIPLGESIQSRVMDAVSRTLGQEVAKVHVSVEGIDDNKTQSRRKKKSRPRVV